MYIIINKARRRLSCPPTNPSLRLSLFHFQVSCLFRVVAVESPASRVKRFSVRWCLLSPPALRSTRSDRLFNFLCLFNNPVLEFRFLLFRRLRGRFLENEFWTSNGRAPFGANHSLSLSLPLSLSPSLPLGFNKFDSFPGLHVWISFASKGSTTSARSDPTRFSNFTLISFKIMTSKNLPHILYII